MKYIKQANGFSLLELLIAVFLGTLLLGVLLQSYLGAKKIYRTQSDLADLSENMRFADFILWQSITQAGFAGCRRASELDLINHVKDEKYAGLFFGVRGYDSVYLPSYLKGDIVKGTDVIVIGKASSQVVSILENVAKGTDSILVEQNPTTESKHLLLISNCENADLFYSKGRRKKEIVSNASLAHAYNKKNAEIRFFEEVTFFIKYPSDKKNRPIPGLYFCINRGRADELISNVSDMQVSYGINVSGSHQYLKAKKIVDLKLWDKILDVRIDLTMHNKLKLSTKQKRIYIKLRGRR
jgi:hypothetical protein